MRHLEMAKADVDAALYLAVLSSPLDRVLRYWQVPQMHRDFQALSLPGQHLESQPAVFQMAIWIVACLGE